MSLDCNNNDADFESILCFDHVPDVVEDLVCVGLVPVEDVVVEGGGGGEVLVLEVLLQVLLAEPRRGVFPGIMFLRNLFDYKNAIT